MKPITPHAVFDIRNQADFESLALSVFRFQYQNNTLYKKYVDRRGVNPMQLAHSDQIPFLPVSFFKTHEIMTACQTVEKVFSSSFTTGKMPSRHFVHDLSLYRKSFVNTFSFFYGDPKQYVILGLLPGYLERQDASLVYMVHALMKLTGQKEDGFYLHDYQTLVHVLKDLCRKDKKVILFGVTHALLDFSEVADISLPNTIVIETGGMKGKGKELVREELHYLLKSRLGIAALHAEYGMTELLSQAYAREINHFSPPPWMKVLVRDPYDPFELLPVGDRGGLNIIDLANIYSLSFLETQDIGHTHADGSFSVLGRFDQAEVRGCNLMVS